MEWYQSVQEWSVMVKVKNQTSGVFEPASFNIRRSPETNPLPTETSAQSWLGMSVVLVPLYVYSH